MPGKGLMVLLILFVCGSTYGLSLVDFSRPELPHYPPGYADMMAGGQPVPIGPGPVVGDNGGQPEQPDGPGDEPADEPEESDDVRIRNPDILLTKVSPEGTLAVTDPGDGSLVRIEIDKEGGVRFLGINLGDWDFLQNTVRKRLADVENAHVVIIPHQKTPWQYVHWIMDIVREQGVTKIGLGAYPDFDDEKNLLYEVPVLLMPADGEVKLLEDMVEIEVVLSPADDGKGVKYVVFGDAVENQGELFNKVSSINGDYADEFEKEYDTKSVTQTPFVVKADAKLYAGHVILTLNTIRRAAVYSVRFGGEFPPAPGKGK